MSIPKKQEKAFILMTNVIIFVVVTNIIKKSGASYEKIT